MNKMTTYNNFRINNTKKENRNNYNPAFNSSVEAKGDKEQQQFKSNLDKYIEFLSWAR